MHCYFLRKNLIAGVTFLRADSDAGLLRQAEAAFRTHPEHGFDGFEVWAGDRLVHRHQTSNGRQQGSAQFTDRSRLS